MELSIRAESTADIDAVFAVHAASFPTTEEARLVNALRSGSRLAVSLVAEDDGEVVGHVAFSPVRLAGATDGVGLAPLAVLPAFRRRGIAERLVREGLVACRERGLGFVVVIGEPHYYGRFGFSPAQLRTLASEYDAGNAFQVLELRHGTLPGGGGIVRYAPEFALVARQAR